MRAEHSVANFDYLVHGQIIIEKKKKKIGSQNWPCFFYDFVTSLAPLNAVSFEY